MRFANRDKRNDVAAAADLRSAGQRIAIDGQLVAADQLTAGLGEKIIVVMRRADRIVGRDITGWTLKREVLHFVAVVIACQHDRVQRDDADEWTGRLGKCGIENGAGDQK